MIVEFSGIPGSGKSFFCGTTGVMLKRRGQSVDYLWQFARSGSLSEEESEAEFERLYPGLIDAINALPGGPSPEIGFGPSARRLWLEAKDALPPDGFGLFDEGLVHRCAFLAAAGGSKDVYLEVVERLPFIDALVLIDTPLEIAEERASGRMPPERREIRRKKYRVQHERYALAIDLLRAALEPLRKRGTHIEVINGAEEIRRPAKRFAETLIAMQPS